MPSLYLESKFYSRLLPACLNTNDFWISKDISFHRLLRINIRGIPLNINLLTVHKLNSSMVLVF